MNMGKFFDSLDGSRRTFMVEFQAPEKYWHELKRICQHSSAEAFGWVSKRNSIAILRCCGSWQDYRENFDRAHCAGLKDR